MHMIKVFWGIIWKYDGQYVITVMWTVQAACMCSSCKCPRDSRIPDMKWEHLKSAPLEAKRTCVRVEPSRAEKEITKNGTAHITNRPCQLDRCCN